MTAKRPAYITMQEAAERTGFSVRTIRNWIAAGKLPAVRFGRHIRLNPDDLDRLAVPVVTVGTFSARGPRR